MAKDRNRRRYLDMTSLTSKPLPGQSELQNFAQWFHQDSDLLFASVHAGARIYIASLPPDRKSVLRAELEALLATYPGKDGRGLTKAWFRLGAQAWPGGRRSRDMLEDILAMMS